MNTLGLKSLVPNLVPWSAETPLLALRGDSLGRRQSHLRSARRLAAPPPHASAGQISCPDPQGDTALKTWPVQLAQRRGRFIAPRRTPTLQALPRLTLSSPSTELTRIAAKWPIQHNQTLSCVGPSRRSRPPGRPLQPVAGRIWGEAPLRINELGLLAVVPFWDYHCFP